MNAVTNSLQVVNTLTGEITQLDYKNIFELKNAMLEIDAWKKAIEKAERQLKADLEYAMGDDEVVEFPDGYRAKRYYNTRYEYKKEIVAKYLDADQLDLVTKIDGVALKSLVKDMSDDHSIEPGAWADIEASADRKNSSYIRIIKSVG